jgi:hypothetical protein
MARAYDGGRLWHWNTMTGPLFPHRRGARIEERLVSAPHEINSEIGPIMANERTSYFIDGVGRPAHNSLAFSVFEHLTHDPLNVIRIQWEEQQGQCVGEL